jgi:phospholipid N-methyltransferase
LNIPRTIVAEWLDELPADDPRAQRSRRDLRRINALMMNSALVVRELLRAFPEKPPRTIAEIGAGDGSFMLRIAEKLPSQWRGTSVVLMDQQNLLSAATSEEFVTTGWRIQALTADVFSWLAQPAVPVFDVIVANLFLHHFDAPQLAVLLSLIEQRTRVLIACEPQRSGRALLGSRLLGLIGCNDVSRHDAVVSVRAGFKNRELSGLWPAGSAWTLREHAHGLFSHCFVATRADGDPGAGRTPNTGRT